MTAGTSGYFDWIAQTCALRGDAGHAVEWLERASTPDLPFLLADPLILRLRDDPRFIAFCKKVGLPPLLSSTFTLAFGADFTFWISDLGLSHCHSSLILCSLPLKTTLATILSEIVPEAFFPAQPAHHDGQRVRPKRRAQNAT